MNGCTDPIEPEFKYIEGLVYIEGLATNVEGASYVSIFESVLEFGVNKNVFVQGADVNFVNSNTGTQVKLIEEGELYIPPTDFTANIGETWELSVVLLNGKQYYSEEETLTMPVEISQIDVSYSSELFFSEEYNSFVPGHSISVSFNDPPDRENFYYWRYRSFEKLTYCWICNNGFFRNGECDLFDPRATDVQPYYTYGCEEDCWRVRYGDKIEIFSDNFTNGTTINKLPVANITLHTKGKILVEMQQFSLSPKAYAYYKVIKDLVDNNSGFNAPLPSALLGNIFNPNDQNEFVLGRFSAAPASIEQILIDRSEVEEFPLETQILPITEGFGDPVPPPITEVAPCREGRFRTGVRPVGWQD